jgi:hypothetical protein
MSGADYGSLVHPVPINLCSLLSLGTSPAGQFADDIAVLCDRKFDRDVDDMSTCTTGVTALQLREPLGEITNVNTETIPAGTAATGTAGGATRCRRSHFIDSGPRNRAHVAEHSPAAQPAEHLLEKAALLGVLQSEMRRERRRALEPSLLEQQRLPRNVMVDWLIDVHATYAFKSQTLFLTVSIIDRFFCSRRS